jgi:recA bacterial DNA recombination protein
MSHALRKITANASKCHCTVLFLNQLRFKVGLLASTEECFTPPLPARLFCITYWQTRAVVTMHGEHCRWG